MVLASQATARRDGVAVTLSFPQPCQSVSDFGVDLPHAHAFALAAMLHYDGRKGMPTSATATAGKIVCDGCGLGTTSDHIARRLHRLELATRFRPIHIQAVFLSAQSPAEGSAFLYGGNDKFTGEAAALLRAANIEFEGRDAESVLSEFQRKGYLLVHALECAPEEGSAGGGLEAALRARVPALIRKIRGSLKPKRVVIASKELAPILGELQAAQTGVEWVLDGEKPFDLSDRTSVSKLTIALQSL